MKPKRFAIFGIFVLLSSVLSLSPLAAQPAVDRPPVDSADLNSARLVIERGVLLSQRQNANFRSGEIDLGDIPIKSRVELSLLIINDSDRELDFSRARVQSNCETFRMDQTAIKTGEGAPATLSFTVPATSRAADQIISIVFEGSRATEAIIQIRYRLEGMLVFKEPMSLVEVPRGGEMPAIDLPIMVTPPVDIRTLTILLPIALSDWQAEVVPDEEGLSGFVRLSVSGAASVRRNVSGEIKLRDPRTEAQDSHMLMIRPDDPVKMSPDVIRLRKQNGRLSGSVIVRRPPNPEDTPAAASSTFDETIDRPDSLKLTIIDCRIGNTNFEVQSSELVEGVYRVHVSIDAERFSQQSVGDSNPMLDWSFSGPGLSSSKRTRVITDE